MKFTAHEFIVPRLSVAQDASAANAQGGNWIDCQGYAEALCFLETGPYTGTLPTMTTKWREASDDPANPGTPLSSTIVDIAGATFGVVTVVPDRIVAVVNLTNVALTIAAQPANPSRISVTVTDTTPSIVSGTVTIVGTRPPRNFAELTGQNPLNAGNQPYTESIDFASFVSGTAKLTTGIFATITSVTCSNFAVLGGAGDETIKVGVDNSGPQCPQVGRLNLQSRLRYIQAYTTKGGTSPVGATVLGAVLLDASGGAKLPVSQVIPALFNIA